MACWRRGSRVPITGPSCRGGTCCSGRRISTGRMCGRAIRGRRRRCIAGAGRSSRRRGCGGWLRCCGGAGGWRPGCGGGMSGLAQRRAARRGPPRAFPVAPGVARGVVVAALVVGGGGRVGADAGGVGGARRRGPELTPAVAGDGGDQAAAGAGAAAAVWWRLGMGVGRVGWRLCGGRGGDGGGAGADLANGACRRGALLLHGGLAVTVVLLWRDPGTVARLEMTLRRRGSRRWVGGFRRV